MSSLSKKLEFLVRSQSQRLRKTFGTLMIHSKQGFSLVQKVNKKRSKSYQSPNKNSHLFSKSYQNQNKISRLFSNQFGLKQSQSQHLTNHQSQSKKLGFLFLNLISQNKNRVKRSPKKFPIMKLL
jgi:hypothetical protein